MTDPLPTPFDNNSAGRLLAAALQQFNANGVNATSIHDICAAAKVSIGSAYHHFGSKQALADALLVGGLDSNCQALEQRLADVTGAQAGVRTVVLSLVDWISAHPEWARFIYTASDANARAKAGAALKDINRRYKALIERHFKPHLASGEIRQLPSECYHALLIGPVHDYARRQLAGAVKAPLKRHAALFADSAWQAVAAQPGA